MKIKLLLLILFISSNAFAENLVCTTEVRHYCNDLETCVRNADNSTYEITLSQNENEMEIKKSISNTPTSQWKAKLISPPSYKNLVYVEMGVPNMTFTLNANKSRFVLLFPNTDKNSAWAQVEIGICR